MEDGLRGYLHLKSILRLQRQACHSLKSRRAAHDEAGLTWPDRLSQRLKKPGDTAGLTLSWDDGSLRSSLSTGHWVQLSQTPLRPNGPVSHHPWRNHDNFPREKRCCLG